MELYTRASSDWPLFRSNSEREVSSDRGGGFVKALCVLVERQVKQDRSRVERYFFTPKAAGRPSWTVDFDLRAIHLTESCVSPSQVSPRVEMIDRHQIGLPR